VGGRATQVTPEDQDGYPCYPKWSPDGERIFLRWGRGNIVSIPAQGGKLTAVHDQEKTGLVSAIPGMGNCISPDGNTVVFTAGKIGTQPLEVCIWTAQVAGGESKQITRSESPTQDRYPCLSPNGKSVAFIRSMEKPGEGFVHHIFVTSSEGGEARQITSESNKVGYASIDWSPDGRWIAYFSQDKTINLIPSGGGEHRVLLEVERFGAHSNLSWSPDGKELAYTSAGPSNMGRLMVVSADGGEPREVKTGVLNKGAQNFHIDWSPDGSKFVFSAGFGGDSELWLMENFSHLLRKLK
jgi:Tol biopolymer transport system component